MVSPGRKQCVVAYATRERQYMWTVDVSADATIADVIEAAKRMVIQGSDEVRALDALSGHTSPARAAPMHAQPADSSPEDIPWATAPVGVFGELRERTDCPADGDRVEIYRPLRSDPRDRRRERVQRQRKTTGR